VRGVKIHCNERLQLHTRTRVEDFLISNWTDHFVETSTRKYSEDYTHVPLIVVSHSWSVWRIFHLKFDILWQSKWEIGSIKFHKVV